MGRYDVTDLTGIVTNNFGHHVNEGLSHRDTDNTNEFFDNNNAEPGHESLSSSTLSGGMDDDDFSYDAMVTVSEFDSMLLHSTGYIPSRPESNPLLPIRPFF
jgi:hypothetical protein